MRKSYIKPETEIIGSAISLLQAASIGWYDEDGIWHPGERPSRNPDPIDDSNTETAKRYNPWESTWDD